MDMKINKGLASAARQVPSPNCDERPDESDISLIVVHSISLPPGKFGGSGIDQLFTNQLDPEEHPYYQQIQSLRVSSHLLIRRDGELVQYVPFHKRAWHAGESVYKKRGQCNDFSIGIELEGSDDEPYEEIQYEVLIGVIRSLCEYYPKLRPNQVAGHCDVSPGRKTDPGPAFNWQRLTEALA